MALHKGGATRQVLVLDTATIVPVHAVGLEITVVD